MSHTELIEMAISEKITGTVEQAKRVATASAVAGGGSRKVPVLGLASKYHDRLYAALKAAGLKHTEVRIPAPTSLSYTHVHVWWSDSERGSK